jgi:hypothetical protein
MDGTTLFMALLLGSIGMGYAMYGRRQRRGAALLSGVLLMVVPYFVASAWLVGLIGVGLMALPFFASF